MYALFRRKFFKIVNNDTKSYFQCKMCRECFFDSYPSQYCEKCYYDELYTFTSLEELKGMDQHYRDSMLADELVDVAPDCISQFVSSFLKLYDSRYVRSDVDAFFRYKGKVKGNYDIYNSLEERERWVVPLSLGIFYDAFIRGFNVPFSSYVEIWLDILPSDMIYHTDGFKRACFMASQVPYAIVATSFNVDFFMSLFHVIINGKGLGNYLVPSFDNTIGVDSIARQISDVFQEESDKHEAVEEGMALVDMRKQLIDPGFWEPVIAVIASGKLDDSYGTEIEIVVPADTDDIGRWAASIETDYGEYNVWVRRDCCAYSYAWATPDTDETLQMECLGNCGRYERSAAAYNPRVVKRLKDEYRQRITSTLVMQYADPVWTARVKASVNLVNTPDDNWSMLIQKERTYRRVSARGSYVFKSDYCQVQDYALCAMNCEHLVCNVHARVEYYCDSKVWLPFEGSRRYVLSDDEMFRIKARQYEGYSVPRLWTHVTPAPPMGKAEEESDSYCESSSDNEDVYEQRVEIPSSDDVDENTQYYLQAYDSLMFFGPDGITPTISTLEQAFMVPRETWSLYYWENSDARNELLDQIWGSGDAQGTT
jgi:hypothetical protein